MSLDKAIAHGKERRRPYRKAARFDPACRSHKGACGYCSGNRTYQHTKAQQAAHDRSARDSS